MHKKIGLILGLGMGMAVVPSLAQTADQAWLRYGRIAAGCVAMPLTVRTLGAGALENAAARELERSNRACWGASGASARSARTNAVLGGETVLGTVAEVQRAFPGFQVPSGLRREGYWTQREGEGIHGRLWIVGADEAGVLYGAFSVLRSSAMGLEPDPNRRECGASQPCRCVGSTIGITRMAPSSAAMRAGPSFLSKARYETT